MIWMRYERGEYYFDVQNIYIDPAANPPSRVQLIGWSKSCKKSTILPLEGDVYTKWPITLPLVPWILFDNPAPIEEGFIQKKRQRSSLLYGRQNLVNFLPR